MHQSDEPLLKYTLNFYLADIEFLQTRYGYGISGVIRDQIRKYVKQIKDEEDGK